MNESITEVMTTQVRHITLQESITVARDLMVKYDIHHLPVLDEGNLVGILSSNDINRAEYLCDFIGEKIEKSVVFKSLSIEELMTEEVVSLTTDSSVLEAIEIFSNASFHCLPVTEDGRLVGIVSTKDVFSHILQTA